ncbi:hypothetical protein KEM52_003519, partial [Ascosphaera acerosa]
MQPIKLGFGLNAPAKKKAAGSAAAAAVKPSTRNAFAGGPSPSQPQKRRKPVFGEDDEEEERGDGGGDGGGRIRDAEASEVVEISTFGSASDSSAPAPTDDPSSQPPARKKQATAPSQARSSGTGPPRRANEYTNLSSLRSSRKHAQEAEQLDPTIYDYDGVYDSLRAAEEAAKAQVAAAATREGPRYVRALLQSAETRRRDQLRARERLLQREREAEGDAFADKEKFVTAAYQAQQEEARRLEEEEERRARDEEARRRAGAGMVGLYREILARGEDRHEAAVRAAGELAERRRRGEAVAVAETPAGAEDDGDGDADAKKRAAELNARGARIATNEEGEVVDKRQLLSAGLNVAPPKARAP